VTEREIIEAELREIISLEEYETSSGLGREEYESDVMTWSCAIAAALRESRKLDLAIVKETLGYGRALYPSERRVALAALSRLAGDE
jgi:hypothetical protein